MELSTTCPQIAQVEIVVQTVKLFLCVDQTIIYLDMVTSYAEGMDNGIYPFQHVKVNVI